MSKSGLIENNKLYKSPLFLSYSFFNFSMNGLIARESEKEMSLDGGKLWGNILDHNFFGGLRSLQKKKLLILFQKFFIS